MKTREALYATVGAPIAAARSLSARLETLRSQLESRSSRVAELAEKRIAEWAEEGRQVVSKVSDGKMVDELTSKVDFDQAREQVTKLRDQLEDMLATWRSSFRPETVSEPAPAEKAEAAPTPKPATKTTTRPAGKKTPAKKKPAAKTAAKTTTAKKQAPGGTQARAS